MRLLLNFNVVSVWNVLLNWVPLSEGVNVIAVLNLLGNDRGRTALIVIESDSILANVRLDDAVVNCA